MNQVYQLKVFADIWIELRTVGNKVVSCWSNKSRANEAEEVKSTYELGSKLRIAALNDLLPNIKYFFQHSRELKTTRSLRSAASRQNIIGQEH